MPQLLLLKSKVWALAAVFRKGPQPRRNSWVLGNSLPVGLNRPTILLHSTDLSTIYFTHHASGTGLKKTQKNITIKGDGKIVYKAIAPNSKIEIGEPGSLDTAESLLT